METIGIPDTRFQTGNMFSMKPRYLSCGSSVLEGHLGITGLHVPEVRRLVTT